MTRTLILVVMLQTAAQLQLFGQAQLLTGGGPSGASRTVVPSTRSTEAGTSSHARSVRVALTTTGSSAAPCAWAAGWV